jgi:hypothetical protein
VSRPICFAAPAQIDELIRAGKIIPETRMDLARFGIGVASAPAPLSPTSVSVDAFTRALSLPVHRLPEGGAERVYVAVCSVPLTQRIHTMTRMPLLTVGAWTALYLRTLHRWSSRRSQSRSSGHRFGKGSDPFAHVAELANHTRGDCSDHEAAYHTSVRATAGRTRRALYCQRHSDVQLLG